MIAVISMREKKALSLASVASPGPSSQPPETALPSTERPTSQPVGSGPPPPEAIALARALARADGDEDRSELWAPFAGVVWTSFPDGYTIVETAELDRLKLLAQPERQEILHRLVRACRSLLVHFLDTSKRAIALGEIAKELRALDQQDFHDGD